MSDAVPDRVYADWRPATGEVLLVIDLAAPLPDGTKLIVIPMAPRLSRKLGEEILLMTVAAEQRAASGSAQGDT